MYIANDNNANGSMGFGTMGKEGETFTNLTSLWDQSGITSTKVHPQTGAVFIGYHTGSWVYQYDENSFVPKIQLPDDTGKPAEKGNINGIAFDKSETIVYIVSRKNHVIYKDQCVYLFRVLKHHKYLYKLIYFHEYQHRHHQFLGLIIRQHKLPF